MNNGNNHQRDHYNKVQNPPPYNYHGYHCQNNHNIGGGQRTNYPPPPTDHQNGLQYNNHIHNMSKGGHQSNNVHQIGKVNAATTTTTDAAAAAAAVTVKKDKAIWKHRRAEYINWPTVDDITRLPGNHLNNFFKKIDERRKVSPGNGINRSTGVLWRHVQRNNIKLSEHHHQQQKQQQSQQMMMAKTNDKSSQIETHVIIVPKTNLLPTTDTSFSSSLSMVPLLL